MERLGTKLRSAFHRPTPWNRTRTSRASAGRPDQLGESGIYEPRAHGPRGRSPAGYSVVRWRAQGAPRALARPLSRRSHLSPGRARERRERTLLDYLSSEDRYSKLVMLFASPGSVERGRKFEGPLGCCRAALPCDDVRHVRRLEDLRYRYPSETRRCRTTHRSRACAVPTGYGCRDRARVIPRTMKRVTVRQRSVKCFFVRDC